EGGGAGLPGCDSCEEAGRKACPTGGGAAMGVASGVVCAGIIVADHVSSPISHLPAAGELVLADQLVLTIGGCAANVAVDLVKLGVPAGVVGRGGGDGVRRGGAQRLRARDRGVPGPPVLPRHS